MSNVTSINGVLVERFERIFITATGDITFNKSEFKYCMQNFIYNEKYRINYVLNT